METKKITEIMEELRSTIKDASNTSLKLHQELAHQLIISGDGEREYDNYTLNYLIDNNSTLYRQLNAFRDDKWGRMQGRLIYGDLFDELCSAIKNVPTKENQRVMAAGNMATLIIEKPGTDSTSLSFLMDVNKKKSSITFKLGGTADGRTFIGEIKLTSKGNLCYSSIYEPMDSHDYAFGKRLENCVKEDPVQFLTNLIAEIKSIHDGNEIFSEFNNDSPIITGDFDHHNVNSVVLSLLRIHNGYNIIDSLDALKNKEFNNTFGCRISNDFCNWTERFFEEKGGMHQGNIRVNENNMIKIHNRYIIRFTDSTLYFYISKKSFELIASNTIKGYFFCYDSEEILDHLKIFKWDSLKLNQEMESILSGICPRSFINKYTKLLSYANYFENWNEIIEKAFDVENNIKGKDSIKNFISMINYFMNYDLSI